MNIQQALIVKLSVCSMLFYLLLFIPFGFAKTDLDTKSLMDNHIQSMITDYKNKIISNQIEILEIEKDLEWLNYKIKHAQYSNHPVSGDIQTSLHYKTSKIFALKNKIAYCRERLKYFQKQVRPLKKSQTDIGNRDVIKKLQSRIQTSGLSGWLEIKQDEKESNLYKLKTVLPILFASGSAEIIKEYEPFLKQFATIIKDFATKIIVDGYADIDPIHTKQYPSNFELGAVRASNVVHSLIRYGVKPSAFKIATTGKYRFLPLKMKRDKTLERYVAITVFISI